MNKKKALSRWMIVVLVLSISLFFVPAALAHPLGNFTINHYAGLLVSQQSVRIDYVRDLAEIPAFQEIAAFDADGDGQPDAEETAGYAPAQCEMARLDLILRLGGRQLPLELVSSAVEFPPGQGGLLTLRLSCGFEASIQVAGSQPVRVEFENRSHAERLGWREIVVVGDGVALQGDYAVTSPSRRLSSYPADLLSSPLDQRRVQFDATLSGAYSRTSSPSSAQATVPLPADRNDAFTRLVLLEKIDLPALLFALAVSFVWGAMHALTPGHGKTIVGAYLVGSRGTARHALYLGLATTITHTAGVFALGMVTLFAARYILPEKLFPWLSLLSGLLVAGIGLSLFLKRLRAAGFRRSGTMVGGLKTSLIPLPSLQAGLAPRGIRLAAQARGAALLPSHGHVHLHEEGLSGNGGHEDSHSHSGDPHHHPVHHHGSGSLGHTHPVPDDAHEHDHDHEHAGHTHLPPGADGAPVTWRSLLALGVSGGLLPCPSALVVLLSAIALNRVGFGLVLVLAFSLGLAAVLTGIGLMFVYAGRLFERLPVQGRLLRILPVFSALFIALVGLGIAARTLVEMGLPISF